MIINLMLEFNFYIEKTIMNPITIYYFFFDC